MIDNIESINVNTFLGVIDDKLSWRPHINHIKNKISKSIAILNKTKYILGKSLHLLYSNFIGPYIAYCVEVWGYVYKTITKPIFILQERTIRIINRANYHEIIKSMCVNVSNNV